MFLKQIRLLEIVILLLCCVLKWNLVNCDIGREKVHLLSQKPKWLQTCKRDDPKINDCLKTLFTMMFPELASGIPEISLAPFEPLKLERVSVSKGNGAVTLAGSLYNMTVSGPSEAQPTYSKLDLSKGLFDFGINLPRLDVKGLYDLKGRVLVLPLVGRGDAELALHGVETHVTTRFSLPRVLDQEGIEREVFRVENMKVKFTLDKMRVHLTNLFNGNKILGATVNNFLNENAGEVVSELSDNIGDSLAEIFTDLMNKIFNKIPTDLWLPAANENTTTSELSETTTESI